MVIIIEIINRYNNIINNTKTNELRLRVEEFIYISMNKLNHENDFFFFIWSQ